RPQGHPRAPRHRDDAARARREEGLPPGPRRLIADTDVVLAAADVVAVLALPAGAELRAVDLGAQEHAHAAIAIGAHRVARAIVVRVARDAAEPFRERRAHVAPLVALRVARARVADERVEVAGAATAGGEEHDQYDGLHHAQIMHRVRDVRARN